VSILFASTVEEKLRSKHNVSLTEVLQCFENRSGGLLIDTREKHRTDPPTQWFISETNANRRLKVVFVQKGEHVFVKTAYEPNADEESIYKTKA